MAFSLSPYLKLRIDDNLTANAKYNLNKLDLLGSTFIVDTTDSLRIRSITDIQIEPNSADIGGSGSGGDVSIGDANHELDSFSVFAEEINLSAPLSLLDQAVGGNKSLLLQYKSDINGPVDTVADRTLSFDLDGADRNLTLGGSVQILGADLVLNLTGNTSLTLPTTGTLVTTDAAQVLINKTIDADLNTVSNIDNGNIKASAGIIYSKLDLSDSILDSDINSAAGIVYSKLNLLASIVNADISPSAAILYSKLDLADSIVNADINSAAGIDYSKLDLALSIVDGDVSPTAAIMGTKVNPNFGSQNLFTSGELQLSNGSFYTSLEAGAQIANISLTLPAVAPSGNQLLRANTSDPTQLEWATIAGTGTVTSVGLTMPSEFSVGGSPVTTAGTLAVSLSDQADNTVFAGPNGGGPLAPSFRALVEADLPEISLTKIEELTTHDRVLVSSALGVISESSVTTTTLGYLDATSSIQTQINSKQSTSEKGNANGYASLDALGKIPSSQLPSSVMEYKGAWDASTNTPTLADGVGDNGDAYRVSVAGTQDLGSGSVSYNVGDLIVYSGTLAIWQRCPASDLAAFALTALSNLTVAGLAAGSLLVGSSGTQVVNLAVGSNGQILQIVAGSPAWTTVVDSFKTDWITADGTTKVVTHSLGSLDVMVQLYDKTDGSTIYPDTALRTDTNTVTLTASQAPGAAGWRVMIKKV